MILTFQILKKYDFLKIIIIKMGFGNTKISDEGNNNKNDKQSLLSSQNFDNLNSSKLNLNSKNNKFKETMKQEMKKYQNIIKKERKNINKKSEEEEANDSEDIRLKYMMGKKLGVKKKFLSLDEIDEGIKQDEKENEKRKGRKTYFSPIKKEIPFKHRESEGPYDPNESKPYTLGYENEIYKGINYGKPIKLYDQTWLTYDVPVEPNIYGPKIKIPPGWRIPTLEDYKKLFKWVGDNEKIKILLTHERLLNMKTNYQYITSDKVFKDNNKGKNQNPWAYFCIGFNFFDEVDYPGIEKLKKPINRKKINDNNINIKNNSNKE